MAVVQELLEGGARVDSMSIGVSALHLAAQYGRVKVARLLLAKGAKIHLLSSVDMATPLYYAIGRGHITVVELLLHANASALGKQHQSGGFPLLYAASTEFREGTPITNLLLERGADVSEVTSEKGLSSLHVAISAGNLAGVKVLMKAGANLMRATGVGETVLHLAVKSENESIFRALITALSGKCSGRESPSCIESQQQRRRLLDARSLSDGGCTALHLAVIRGKRGMVQSLLEAGALVDAVMSAGSERVEPSQSFEGATPLLLAAKAGHQDIVQKLLEHQADPDHPLLHGSQATPLLIAIEGGHSHIVQLLLTGPEANEKCLKDEEDATCGSLKRSRADPNKGGRGAMQSPLLFAVVRSQATTVRLLLEAGASCNVLVQRSRTDPTEKESLAEFAQRRRDYDTLQSLLSFPDCSPERVHANDEE